MQNNRDVIVGVFDDQTQAERAVEALHSAGFTDQQIGFARRGNEGQGSGGAEGGLPDEGTRSQGGKGLAGGAIAGGIIGAAAALLIPGVGPVIAGGILAPLLGGAVTAAGVGAAGAAAGAAVGGLAGGLAGLGIPENEAKYYEGEFESGRTIVTIRPGDRWSEAEAILQRYGAYDAEHGAPLASTQTTEQTTESTRAAQAHTTAQQSESMPLREERLSVGKRSEVAGEARVTKEVVEQNLSVDVPVSREEVVIRERQVDAPASGPVGESEEISVPVSREEVDVAKNAKVYGEVEVGKQKVEETRRVRDTVRKEVPRVEKTGDVDVEVDDDLPDDDPRLKKAS